MAFALFFCKTNEVKPRDETLVNSLVDPKTATSVTSSVSSFEIPDISLKEISDIVGGV